MAMREILFRGKRINNGEWVSSGNLITFNDEGEGKQFFIPEANAKCTSSHDEQDNIIAFPSGVFYKVDPKTIGQYTGRTDKNGKKIFEGDVCRFYGTDGCSDYVVFWDDTVSQWTVRQIDLGAKDVLDSYFAECCEVIGNIHDTPELLEVTAE